MANHSWPGNVRELRNVVERAAILHPGIAIGAEDIELLLHRSPRVRAAEREALWSMSKPAEVADPIPAPAAPQAASPEGPICLKSMLADIEHRYIVDALRRSKGVVADAARMLTLQRTTLIEKMNKYGIDRVTV
jgi:sigma-54 specific flagellar transcriptional regulator A